MAGKHSFESTRTMTDLFDQLPTALRSAGRLARLGGSIPALLAHPDWTTPTGTMIWLHGRTAYKELDPGRYLRWLRAGLAVCAIDLPGHGERFEAALQTPQRTLDMLNLARGEIDRVIEALAGDEFGGVFDLDRMGIGGMSAGGMVTLRRLCEGHDFRCAAVEGTTGWLEALYFPQRAGLGERALHRWSFEPPIERVAELDPMAHLSTLEPLPLLWLHSEADEVVPIAGMRGFVDRLAKHYESRGKPRAWIEGRTWPTTGAPEEHVGFGQVSNEAKNVQTEFLVRYLGRGAGQGAGA
jgi:alpha-beta hydrolase superfamily lysophospholipase